MWYNRFITTYVQAEGLMLDKRASGILLHPTSLPSPHGIGDLGDGAYQFVDFLVRSHQSVWQILPLGPTGFGNSPYLCYSALAGNPLLIGPDKLREAGWISSDDLASIPPFPDNRVDYDGAIAYKYPLLKRAADRFREAAAEGDWDSFHSFCERQAFWLEDYALFMALKIAHGGTSWYEWEPGIAQRKLDILEDWTRNLKDAIFEQKFYQYQFFEQWSALKAYANAANIHIFGDIPIYVAHDSADVWASPEIFCLDQETGKPELMAGVPPDYFSATGQLWGNPVYNWAKLESTEFQWWIERFKGTLQYVDVIRIDHFRGFQAYWAVPKGEETAIYGEWIEAPGELFFSKLYDALGSLPIVAEDLGVITPEVETLRDRFAFPGMKILQFAFDSDRANPFLPFNFTKRNAVVYTGTHDNDTTLGWFEARSPEERARVVDYLGCTCPEGIHWSLIRLALGSVANLSVFPLQDLLGLGSDARMNRPSTIASNWEWRYPADALSKEVSDRMAHLTELYGRRRYSEPS